MAAGACRCKRQGDDDGFDAQLVFVGDQIVVVAVHFDVLAGFVFRFPAVFGHQAGANFDGVVARPIAVERAMNVVRADIGDGRHLHVIGRERADQHAPFVAGADEADAHRVVDLGVLEVHRPQTGAGNDAGGDRAHQEFAARQLAADGGVKVFFTDRFFFGSQIHELWSRAYR